MASGSNGDKSGGATKKNATQTKASKRNPKKKLTE